MSASIDGKQVSPLKAQISSTLVLGSEVQFGASMDFSAVVDVIANAMRSLARCVQNAIGQSKLRNTAIARCNKAEQVVRLVVGVEESGQGDVGEQRRVFGVGC